MLNSVYLLILVPLLAGFLSLFFKKEKVRRCIVYLAAFFTVILVGLAFVNYLGYAVKYFLLPEYILKFAFVLELLISALLVYLSVKHRRPIALIFTLLQVVALFVIEHTRSEAALDVGLMLDKLSLIMIFIIGVIGSLITIYALGYMKAFHEEHHPEIKDRRPLFFFLLFIFLAAMFGIVVANDLSWLLFCWEITTLCSFLLIGYKGNEESINNSFTALQYNLLGGLALAVGMIYLQVVFGVSFLDKMLMLGRWEAMFPAVLFAIAGLTKSAQLPFSSWLLGAMVAPTPVSALLHSSTMVKAGVFLLVKLAPLYRHTVTGQIIAFLGVTTFIITSFIAVSQSDAKKVLAYSTIANLGLIVLCAGIGTYESVWAAVLLIIFHAVAKCLLFLCVGSVEHKLHSRNIESMDGLIIALPRLSWFLLVGMAGMFLAPFGMLISKWAVLKSILDASPLLSVLLIYGSAPTLLFWVKWMGKILAVAQPREDKEDNISRTEWFPLYTLAFLTVIACLTFPIFSHYIIEPYVIGVYGFTMTMSRGNIIIMLMMLVALVIMFPFSLPRAKTSKENRIVDTYLSGINVPGQNVYISPLGEKRVVAFKSYYFENYFGENRLNNPALVAGWIILIVLLGMALCR